MNSLPLKQTKIIVGGVLVLLLAGFLFFYSDYQATREQAADITGTLAKIQQEYIRTFVAQGRFPRFNQEANLPKSADARFGAIQSAIVMKDQRLFLVIKDRAPNDALLEK
ncbi:MAG: hypothetical protein ACPGZU_17310, partial [Ketobacter sp.]